MSLRKLFDEKKFAAISKKENLQEVEEEIYKAFGEFLMNYQNNTINFQDLSNAEIAILNATPLGIKLLLEEGQGFEVKKVTKSKIYIMYYQGNSKSNKNSSKVIFSIFSAE